MAQSHKLFLIRKKYNGIRPNGDSIITPKVLATKIAKIIELLKLKNLTKFSRQMNKNVNAHKSIPKIPNLP